MKKSNSFIWIFKCIRRRIPALVVMILAHVAQAVLGVAFALGTRQVIDCAVDGARDAFVRACVWQGLIIVGILVCMTTYRHLREYLSATLDRDWKKDLLHGILHGDYASVSKYHSGELMNRLNNDVRVVNDGVLSVIPGVASMAVRLVAAIVVLAMLEPWFTAVIVVLGIVVIGITGLVRRHLKGLHKKVSEHDGIVSGFLQEAIEKLLMIQAMDVAGEIKRRADGLMNTRFRMQRKRKNMSLLANTCVSIMYYGAGFLALVWCAVRMLHGQMSFGSLTAVIQLVNQLQAPFVGLSGVIPQYIAMTAAAERLMELKQACKAEVEIKQENLSAQEIYGQMESIVGDAVRFSYEKECVLDDVNFEIKKGSFAVITGTSGAGKSTLLKLMLGIFKLDDGRIYVNHKDGAVTLDRGTRNLFAYVPQGNLILSGTLRENLLLTCPEATKDAVDHAVYVSAMDDFVAQLPEGLETKIGENGMGLSEGQAQRVAIARAVLSGAPVLLLDECTSALDEVTERKVLERLKGLEDRMCIAVTHRPAAVEMCDMQIEI